MSPAGTVQQRHHAALQLGFYLASWGMYRGSSKDKKEHSCTVAKDAKITCDGKDCKLEDLKKGVKVKVTIDKKMATKIEGSTK